MVEGWARGVGVIGGGARGALSSRLISGAGVDRRIPLHASDI